MISLGRTNLLVSRLCFGTFPLGPYAEKLSPQEGWPNLGSSLGRGGEFLGYLG